MRGGQFNLTKTFSMSHSMLTTEDTKVKGTSICPTIQKRVLKKQGPVMAESQGQDWGVEWDQLWKGEEMGNRGSGG